MTVEAMSSLPLQAGGAMAAAAGRTALWVISLYMRQPLRNTAIVALVGFSTLAGANALYKQHHHPAPLFGSFAAAPAPAQALKKIAPVMPAERPAKLAAPEITGSVEEPAATPGPQTITNADITKMQQKLASLGMFSGTADGLFGPKTARALRTFEASVGRPQRGLLTPAILAMIDQAPMPAPIAPAPLQQTVVPKPAATPDQPQAEAPIAASQAPLAQGLPAVTAPATQVQAPLAQVQPPVAQVQAPLAQVQAPVAQAQAPVAQAQAPLAPALPQVQTQTPSASNQVASISPLKPLPAPAPLDPLHPLTRKGQPIAAPAAASTDAPASADMVSVENTADTTAATNSTDAASAAETVPMNKLPPPLPKRMVSTIAVHVQQTPAGPVETAAISPQAAAPQTGTPASAEAAANDAQAMPSVLAPATDTPDASSDPKVVAQVQRGLNSLGFLHQQVDGVAGESTAKAIRNFEVYFNYNVTGRVTRELVNLLQQNGAVI